MEKLLIIGGGFAGLNLIKHLDKEKFEVMLVDRNNFHGFPPLFYQIASSGLSESNISFPLRRELKKYPRATYHMGHVKNIDLAAKQVTTSYETLSYDRLILAAGTTNNFFNIENLDQNVFCMKTVAEAAHLRDEILDRLERGALAADENRRKELCSFMVVGGGPAGVEIAGALGDMKREVLSREYPELKPEDVNITLVEGTGRLLGAMSEKAGKKAVQYLEELGVDVRLNTTMKSYNDKIVTFADGSTEYRETLIWTAGVKGEPMPGLPDSALGHAGRIVVDKLNQLPGFENEVYAIGDICIMKDCEDYPKGHPQVAQVAIQQGINLANNLNDTGRMEPFRYRDRGSMATIGKARAVADLPKMFFSGWIAWLAWLAIHLMSLLGMRNKVTVMLNWMWNYITYSTSLRLLLRPTKYPLRRHWGD